MEQQVIEVEHRGTRGKGAARKLRATGMIPGVLYGHKEAPVAFSVNPLELRKRIRASGMGRNTIFKLSGLDRDVLALLKETQVDPVRRDLLHIDLIEVREGDQVFVDVPLEFSGKAAGVVAGGDLQVVRRSIEVACSPLTIPRSIPVDVTPLEIGDTLHAGDLPFPEGVVCTNERLAVVNIKAPRAEAAEGEGEEGAEAAEGAEGAPAAAAPAEGGGGD